MKKTIALLPLAFFLAFCGYTQTNYSFSISSILNSMPNGTRLPNGTIVRAARIVTGTGVHSAVSGTTNPDGMGGTFTGTSFLPSYVGSHDRFSFTVIETSNTNTVADGFSNNCQNGIGFRIYFDRPTIKISFLSLDIDGLNTTPNGNAEWVSSVAYNGSTFVPYDQLVDPSLTVANVTINTSSGTHAWKTLITNTVGATAAAALPNPYPIKRAAGGGIPPDDLNSQVVFTPADPNAAVTDFFLLWGLYRQPAAVNTQASGLSPIVVRVSPDFGDLPDSYKTLLASGGPSHGVVGTLGLGVLETAKADGTPSPTANTDPDDDGVALVSTIANDGTLSQTIPTYSLTTTYFNNTGLAANYAAWIDWNNDGQFQASEGQTAITLSASTSGSVTFTWTNPTLSGAVGQANTYARIRVTTEALTTANSGGALRDGEVEDYLVPFAIALPLKLAGFSARMENEKVILDWKTEDENNTAAFEVQSSSDGVSFSTVGNITAVGNGSHTYSFNDSRRIANIVYYRLKMIDRDGRFTFSRTVVVRNSRAFAVEVSPNPVGAVLNLRVPEVEALTVRVYNSKGQLVKQLKTAPANNVYIDCSDMISGSYYLNIVNGRGETSTTPFVKK